MKFKTINTKTIKALRISIISILLAAVMLIEGYPVSAAVETADLDDSYGSLIDGESIEETPDDTDDEINDEAEPADALYEINEMRTETEKYFRMTDGSITVVRYRQRVHKLNDNGEYEEIDNSLGYDGMSDEYTPVESGKKIKFAKNSNSSKLVSIHEGKYKLGMSLDGSEKSTAETVSGGDIAEYSENRSITRLEYLSELRKAVSSVKYADIMENVDLEYVLMGDDIKENLILKNKSAANEYTYTLKLNGLSAEINGNGEVLLCDSDSGETVYIMPAPFMYDAAGAVSADVSYTITENKNNKVTLKISADREWIESGEREFPVVIDPAFVNENTELENAFVIQGRPDTAHGATGYDGFNVGYSSYTPEGGEEYKVMRGLIKFGDLPVLPDSANVISSYLSLQQAPAGHSTYSYSGSGSNMKIAVKKVTGAWNANAVTWNNKPAMESSSLDYKTLTADTAGKVFSFDVTAAVKDWYAGGSNNGLCVMSMTETQKCYVGFISSGNPYNTVIKPYLTVSYRDTRGLDDRWSYSTQSGGNAGVGNVNLYNGNLVFVKDISSTPGAIIPITISGVYNTYHKNKMFTGNSLDINAPHTPWNSAKMNMGYGWKLSIWESVMPIVESGTEYLVYNDNDGTELYFVKSGNDYISEDGLSLTISVSGSGSSKEYSLKDDYGNVKAFNSDGFIKSITDVHGNRRTFVYDNGRIVRIEYAPAGSGTISESVEKSIKITYYITGELYKIENVDGTYVRFYYSETYNGEVLSYGAGKYLRKIQHSNGTYCEYSYKSTGDLMYATDGNTGNYLYYTYSGSRVERAKEEASNGSGGQSVLYRYGKKKTTVQTSGKDDIISVSSGSDDIKTVYLFDDRGRTVCSYSTDFSGKEVYGAGAAEYINAVSGSRRNNKISKAASTGYHPGNLIVNGSAESGSGWLAGTDDNMSYSTEAAFIGNRSLKIYSGASGVKRAVYQNVSFPSAGTYTVSAYVKAVSYAAPDGKGIYIEVDGNKSRKINSSTVASIQGGFERISVTFDVSAAGSKKVSLVVDSGTGSVYFDCVQAEKSDAPTAYNIVENGSFTNTESWSVTNGGYSTAGFSGRGLVVYGYVDQESRADQFININKPASGTSFVLSGWAKAYSVSPNDSDVITGNIAYAHDRRYFGMRAILIYSDGTEEAQYVSFNSEVRGEWQYASGVIVPTEGNLNKTISRISITTYYAFNANTAYFDDISLTLEAAQVYKYSSKGKLTKITAADGSKDTLTYKANGIDLSTKTNADGSKYTYTYVQKDGKDTHKVDTVTSKTGVKAKYDYDEFGSSYQTKVTASSGDLYIASSCVYRHYGNFVDNATDAEGNVTNFTYDESKGQLLYRDDAKGYRMAFTYDDKYRLTRVYDDTDKDAVYDAGESSVQYVYNSKGYLYQIVTATTTYKFNYEVYGKVTSITNGD